jgi:peptide/nickel transport system substrate-binding protein
MRILPSSILAVALGAATCGASAATFEWASSADIPTWNVHSQNSALGWGGPTFDAK